MPAEYARKEMLHPPSNDIFSQKERHRIFLSESHLVPLTSHLSNMLRLSRTSTSAVFTSERACLPVI